jgi:2'-5' RNA ligase
VDNKRIFIGLELSEAARAACASHVELLRTKFPDVRVGWEQAEKLHTTLKFLGNTDGGVLSELMPRIEEVSQRHGPFMLKLSRTGVFPRASRPRIVWIGASDQRDAIQPIYAELEAACESFDYPKDEKAFRPHITIGRVRDPYEAAALADAHLKTKIEPVEFEVREIVIFESKLQPTGSVYSIVSRHSLDASN